MAGRLRRETADAHHRLETRLDLLCRPVDRQRFVHVLHRFLGFHTVWECAVRRHAGLRAFTDARTRLPHLRRDLVALGCDPAELDQLPLCLAAGELAACEASALGSIYVMEGSTLGGQLIGRALTEVDWLPDGGLAYFNPYGRETGAMWRAFHAFADARLPAQAHGAAVAGARRTFEVLEAWVP
ncbi:biliverdin-producing heme oxygenase [Phenylobacterium sp. J426]|uniref:biliverdin-producing heme oxygenase n=1 Tax=Phenylobacterium sp. J426 TaxID=2898439 RepID=UPI0021517BFB|nr:biliverdin-producing heme oxygenase [Phenylobacterium sp. J426]MCR5876329.1 biliverdin-producing heme oxygenase [Phenylobacterium sp. J426]